MFQCWLFIIADIAIDSLSISTGFCMKVSLVIQFDICISDDISIILLWSRWSIEHYYTVPIDIAGNKTNSGRI